MRGLSIAELDGLSTNRFIRAQAIPFINSQALGKAGLFFFFFVFSSSPERIFFFPKKRKIPEDINWNLV